MKIYVASSWRNLYQPEVVAALRAAGHDVYDFRKPVPGDDGFHWSEIDGGWKDWDVSAYAKALEHPIAARGFASDMGALEASDLVVLVMPSGRSASWEYGHWCGRTGRQGIVHIPEKVEPELMYRGSLFTWTIDGLVSTVDRWDKARPPSIALVRELGRLRPTPELPFEVWSAIGQLVVQPAIELVIRNQDGHVLLTYRKDEYWNAWHFPGGFQSPGESLATTCSRVALRELGVNVDFLRVLHVEHWQSHPYVNTLSIFCECSTTIPSHIHNRTDGIFFNYIPGPMIPMQARFLESIHPAKGQR